MASQIERGTPILWGNFCRPSVIDLQIQDKDLVLFPFPIKLKRRVNRWGKLLTSPPLPAYVNPVTCERHPWFDLYLANVG